MGASGSSFGLASGAAREVLREQVADCGQARQHPRFVASGRELPLHRAADRFPRGIADARLDAAVGDDLHAPVGEQNVNQYPRVVLGVPDAQAREVLQRALVRRMP